MTRRADGTGGARPLLSSGFKFGQAFETRDGKWLVRPPLVLRGGRGRHLRHPGGDSTLVPLATSPASEVHPAVSPDGRWMAYARTNRDVGDLRPPVPGRGLGAVAGLDRRRLQPVWSHSGKELFYGNADND